MGELVSREKAVEALKAGKVLYEEDNDLYYWLQETSIPISGDYRVVMMTDNRDIDEGNPPYVYGWLDSFREDPRDREICNFEGENEMPETAMTGPEALEKMFDGYLVTDGDLIYGIGRTHCTCGRDVDVVLSYPKLGPDNDRPPVKIRMLHEWALDMQDKKFGLTDQILTAELAYKLIQDGGIVQSIDTGNVYYLKDVELYDGTVCKKVFRLKDDCGWKNVEIYCDWDDFKLNPEQYFKIYKSRDQRIEEADE